VIIEVHSTAVRIALDALSDCQKFLLEFSQGCPAVSEILHVDSVNRCHVVYRFNVVYSSNMIKFGELVGDVAM